MADHVHVIQHVGKAVKKVIDRCTRSAAGKQTLDSQLHLFLRNQEDLSAEEEQARASLAQAFPEFNAAWQLKEDSRTWYAIASAQTAVAQLDAWIAHVNQKGPAGCMI